MYFLKFFLQLKMDFNSPNGDIFRLFLNNFYEFLIL